MSAAREAHNAAVLAHATAVSFCLRPGAVPSAVARLARLAEGAAIGAITAERDANRAAATARSAATLRMRTTAILIEESSRKTASLCAEAAARFADEALTSLRVAP